MSLQSEIDARRKEIRTDGYPVSIGEWISLYEKDELDIHPEFQRFFRWKDSQKTALIESILLGIPVPSIFVSQRADGVWDVVDGLQRLSTILQFVGVLRDEDKNLVSPLVLGSTKYLPSLDGVTWDTGKNSLSPEFRLIFKRSKIQCSIILRESDETAKYDLFERLNTGGSEASDQEVRNCILVMINRDMFKWIQNLAADPAFQECIALSERPIREAYDLELVLRFLIFSTLDAKELGSVGDVGIFLSEKMREMAADKSFDFATNEKAFRTAFDMLKNTLSDGAFKKFDVSKSRFQGGFAISQFETVACGIGYNASRGTTPTSIPEKVAGLWSDPAYTDWTGSGITAARRLPRLIPLGRHLFSS